MALGFAGRAAVHRVAQPDGVGKLDHRGVTVSTTELERHRYDIDEGIRMEGDGA
jgi:hypothetical protein